MSVNFYDNVKDDLLKFAVIVSKSDGKWVLVKHKNRNTLEVPGGHREPNENIIDTAKRELIEETGAVDFDLKPICIYSVTEKTTLTVTKLSACFVMRKFILLAKYTAKLRK